jgi:hypothetical protein
LLVSLWFRRSYASVLQSDTNVGTGTLAWTPPLATSIASTDGSAQAALRRIPDLA